MDFLFKAITTIGGFAESNAVVSVSILITVIISWWVHRSVMKYRKLTVYLKMKEDVNEQYLSSQYQLICSLLQSHQEICFYVSNKNSTDVKKKESADEIKKDILEPLLCNLAGVYLYSKPCSHKPIYDLITLINYEVGEQQDGPKEQDSSEKKCQAITQQILKDFEHEGYKFVLECSEELGIKKSGIFGKFMHRIYQVLFKV